MVKKVLYIYGYGSNENSETRTNLQKVLGKSYQVDSIYYNQLQPNEAIEYLSNVVENGCYDCAIGSSLGGFYVMKLWNADVKKIVINPCMLPSVELPKIGCKKDIAARFKKFETYQRDDKKLYGLFGVHDELINFREMFINEASYNIITFNAGHRPTLKELDRISEILKNLI